MQPDEVLTVVLGREGHFAVAVAHRARQLRDLLLLALRHVPQLAAVVLAQHAVPQDAHCTSLDLGGRDGRAVGLDGGDADALRLADGPIALARPGQADVAGIGIDSAAHRRRDAAAPHLLHRRRQDGVDGRRAREGLGHLDLEALLPLLVQEALLIHVGRKHRLPAAVLEAEVRPVGMAEARGDEGTPRFGLPARRRRAEEVRALDREGKLLARVEAAVRRDDLGLQPIRQELLDLERVGAHRLVRTRHQQADLVAPCERVAGHVDLHLGAAPLRELRRQGLVLPAVGAGDSELHRERLRHREPGASDDGPQHDVAARAVDAAVGVEECLVAVAQIGAAAGVELGAVDLRLVEHHEGCVVARARRRREGLAVVRPVDLREMGNPLLVGPAVEDLLVRAGVHRDRGVRHGLRRRELGDPHQQVAARPLDREAEIGDQDDLLVVAIGPLGVARRREEQAVWLVPEQRAQVDGLGVHGIALARGADGALDGHPAQLVGIPAVVAAAAFLELAKVVHHVVGIDPLERELRLLDVHAFQREPHAALRRQVDAAGTEAQRRLQVGQGHATNRVLLQAGPVVARQPGLERQAVALPRLEWPNELEAIVGRRHVELHRGLDLDELRRGARLDGLGARHGHIDVAGAPRVALHLADP